MEKRFPLFVYGTLGDPEIFELLLRRQAVYRDAILPDYELLVNAENGYLFVRPCPGKSLSGKLIEIEPAEFEILDLWEDVPLYTREIATVVVSGQTQAAFVYTQHNTGGRPLSEFQPKGKKEILKEVSEFIAWIHKNRKE